VFIGTMTLKTDNDEANEVKLLNMTRVILADLANPAIVITKRGIIKVYNTSAEKAFGYSAAAVLNKNISMMMPPEYSERHDEILKNYLKTGESKIIGTGRVLPFVCSNGSVVTHHLTLSEKRGSDNKQLYFIGILTNFNLMNKETK